MTSASALEPWLSTTASLRGALKQLAGSHLRALRERQGMTAQHAARRLGLSRAVYTRLELGLHVPDLVTIIAAFQLLGLDAEATDNALGALFVELAKEGRKVVGSWG